MLSLLRFAYGDNLSNFGLIKFMNTMSHLNTKKKLQRLIQQGDVEEFCKYTNDVVECVNYEMKNDEEDNYLICDIILYEDHTVAKRLFEAFRWICRLETQYHWSEVMRTMGHYAMLAAVTSKNTDILEHVMCHVDEELLYDRLLDEPDDHPANIWYDKNFS